VLVIEPARGLNVVIRDEIKPGFTRKSRLIAEAVKNEFIHAWKAYKDYAWGYDYLKPISRTGANFYEVPLAGTIVDALDSLYIMGLDTEFNNAVKWVEENLSFDVNANVGVYSAIIRWLGGLISAYLITGSEKILDLAVDLGNRLLPAYESPTGINYLKVNLKTGAVSGTRVKPAWVGPNIIEMGMLSKLTGDHTYYTKAKNAVKAIYDRRSTLGLIGSEIDVETGSWANTLSVIEDYVEMLEGLIKGWMLFKDPDLFEMGSSLMRSSLKHMAEIYNSMFLFKMVNMDTGELVYRRITTHAQNYGLMLALAGRVTEAVEYTKSLLAFWKWGLTPAIVDYSTWSLIDPAYNCFPEFPEAVSGLHMLLGEEAWRTYAYSVFQNIVKYCKYDVGYTDIADVRTMSRSDMMRTYLLSETFKYLYLAFADSPRIEGFPIMGTQGHIMKGVVPT
jgi:Glycosyl hydrolase family 47.